VAFITPDSIVERSGLFIARLETQFSYQFKEIKAQFKTCQNSDKQTSGNARIMSRFEFLLSNFYRGLLSSTYHRVIFSI
tara:strand:+ start:859 stop:1095 length:237 start_codon:yes stop_codon:yes gene_type:complete